MNWLNTLVFKTFDEKLDKILLSQVAQGQQLDEILRLLKREERHIDPALEAQIKLVSFIAYKIDQKVPDKIVPPS